MTVGRASVENGLHTSIRIQKWNKETATAISNEIELFHLFDFLIFKLRSFHFIDLLCREMTFIRRKSNANALVRTFNWGHILRIS